MIYGVAFKQAKSDRCGIGLTTLPTVGNQIGLYISSIYQLTTT